MSELPQQNSCPNHLCNISGWSTIQHVGSVWNATCLVMIVILHHLLSRITLKSISSVRLWNIDLINIYTIGVSRYDWIGQLTRDILILRSQLKDRSRRIQRNTLYDIYRMHVLREYRSIVINICQFYAHLGTNKVFFP